MSYYANFFFSLQKEPVVLSAPTINQTELQALINETPFGGVLDLVGQTAILDLAFPITRNSVAGNITISNGTIIRAKPKTATLVAELTAGSDQVTVNDTSGFSIGQRTLVIDPGDPNFPQGASANANCGWQVGQILDINGPTLTINVTAVNTMPVGSLLIHSFAMFGQAAGIVMVLDNLTLDGNLAENFYTWDWRYNNCLTMREEMTIRNCHFQNMPCENIFLGGGLLENNSLSNLRGSFVHVSHALPGGPQSIIRGTTGSGVCQSTQVQNWHNEGFVTYSNNAQNVLIEDNIISNCGRSAYGSQLQDDFNIIAQNNQWSNFAQKALYRVPGVGLKIIDPVDTSQDTFVTTPSSGISIRSCSVTDAAGDTIVRLEFNEELVERDALALTDFAIVIDGKTLVSMEFFSDRIDFTMDSAIDPVGGNGTISHTPSATVNKKIMSREGDAMGAFSSVTIVNLLSGEAPPAVAAPGDDIVIT